MFFHFSKRFFSILAKQRKKIFSLFFILFKISNFSDEDFCKYFQQFKKIIYDKKVIDFISIKMKFSTNSPSKFFFKYYLKLN